MKKGRDFLWKWEGERRNEVAGLAHEPGYATNLGTLVSMACAGMDRAHAGPNHCTLTEVSGHVGPGWPGPICNLNYVLELFSFITIYACANHPNHMMASAQIFHYVLIDFT